LDDLLSGCCPNDRLDRECRGAPPGRRLGTLTWYGGFSTAVALTRKRLGDRLLRIVDLAVGSGLILFGSLLAYRTLSEDVETATTS
jgi:hypothetical protein